MHFRRFSSALTALSSVLVTLTLASSAGVAGCSGATSDASPTDASDAATPDPASADDAGTFPAPHPAAPEVVSGGGPVIAAPHVVPVFFTGDTLQGKIEEFLHTLAGSTYWTATTSEYGVGALTIESSVVLADAPPPTDDALRALLAARPEAGPSTVFSVYYPASAPLQVHGKSACGTFDGYHLAGTTAAGASVVYTVSARCAIGAKMLDAVTTSASHELIEATTDPFYESDPAFASADTDHAVWTIATVGEVGDMCAFEPQANARILGDFVVQRSWSNAAAAAGHDPCVPAAPGPYFGAAPVLDESVSIEAGSAGLATKGVRVGVGETRTIDVVLYSDAPTDAWTVSARDGSSLFGGPKELDLSFDRTQGQNGDVLHLTVRPLRAGSYGGSVLVITSKSGTAQHVTFGFVAN